ncbi:MAG: hypothetical protein MSS47_05685, partial [Bacteroidales bacterium]|nr:hypothetical protein [Bacteroidales bacterium]
MRAVETAARIFFAIYGYFCRVGHINRQRTKQQPLNVAPDDSLKPISRIIPYTFSTIHTHTNIMAG